MKFYNLMINECRWKIVKDKKKVWMIRVFVIYFIDFEGMKIDSVFMECCVE